MCYANISNVQTVVDWKRFMNDGTKTTNNEMNFGACGSNFEIAGGLFVC